MELVLFLVLFKLTNFFLVLIYIHIKKLFFYEKIGKTILFGKFIELFYFLFILVLIKKK